MPFFAYPNTMTSTAVLVELPLWAIWMRTAPAPKVTATGCSDGSTGEPELVRRCLGGDRHAWTDLVRLEYKRIYALCRRLGGSADEAQDLTQEVFLKVYNNLASFDPERGSFRAWITTVTRNQVVDHFRRTQHLRLTDSLDEPSERDREHNESRAGRASEDRAKALVDHRLSPHDEAVRRELAEAVEKALDRLRPELREPVVLRDLEDLSYGEIAQMLQLPEGTVKSRISRGRAELARLLQRNRKQVM